MRSRIGRWVGRSEEGRSEERRLGADLEQRGVPAAQARVLAERLETRVAGLDAAAYQLVLDAACAAHDVQRGASRPDAALEIQRLVQDFAVELQKLDEGLQLLSTYLLRIRDRARGGASARLVH